MNHEAVDLQLVFGPSRNRHDLPEQLNGLVAALHRRERGGSHANHVVRRVDEVACLVKRVQGFRQIASRAVPSTMIQAVDPDLLPEFHAMRVLLQGLFDEFDGFGMAAFELVEQVGPQQEGVDERRVENRDQFERIRDPVPEAGMRIRIHLNPEQVRREFGKPELAKEDDEAGRDARVPGIMRVTGMIVVGMRVMFVAGMVLVLLIICMSRSGGLFIALTMVDCRREVKVGLFIVNLEMMPFRGAVRLDGEVCAGAVPDFFHLLQSGRGFRLPPVLFDEAVPRKDHGDKGEDEQGKMLVHALPLTDLFF